MTTVTAYAYANTVDAEMHGPMDTSWAVTEDTWAYLTKRHPHLTDQLSANGRVDDCAELDALLEAPETPAEVKTYQGTLWLSVLAT